MCLCAEEAEVSEIVKELQKAEAEETRVLRDELPSDFLQIDDPTVVENIAGIVLFCHAAKSKLYSFNNI